MRAWICFLCACAWFDEVCVREDGRIPLIGLRAKHDQRKLAIARYVRGQSVSNGLMWEVASRLAFDQLLCSTLPSIGSVSMLDSPLLAHSAWVMCSASFFDR